jgi:hypothetical protein
MFGQMSEALDRQLTDADPKEREAAKAAYEALAKEMAAAVDKMTQDGLRGADAHGGRISKGVRSNPRPFWRGADCGHHGSTQFNAPTNKRACGEA